MKKILVFTLVFALLLSLGLAGCNGDTATDATDATTQDTTTTTAPPDETDEPDETTSEETQEPVMEYKQSPMLDSMNLPPVSERLPQVPQIGKEMPEDEITYEIGKYGGTLRTVRTAVGWDGAIFIIQNEPLLKSPGYVGKEVISNVLKGYEVSNDQKEFTFYLREGLKWSDGEPVTMEDFRFTIEDVIFNEEISTMGPPSWLRSGGRSDGTPMTFTIVNDWEFKLAFDEPYGGFLLQLSIEGWRGYTELLKPSHYMKAYHADHTPLEDLEPMIAEQGFEEGDWLSLFNYMDIINWEFTNPEAVGFPVLGPYMHVQSDDIQIYERNPYYFKVDAEGNQLPYIDKLESTYIQDLEMATVKILAGEVDHSYEFASVPNMGMYKEYEERSGIKAWLNNLHRTATDIFLNMTYDDPVWQEVVQDVRFRQALNLALDKPELVSTVYYEIGAIPADIQGAERDLEEANRLLDEMGMTVGSDGYRVGPDGKRFIIPFDVAPHMQDIIPFTELVVEQWGDLDLNVTMRQIDTGLWGTRVNANEIQATVLWSSGPVMWTWADWGQNFWGRTWWMWYTSNGEQGEEPPEDVLEFYRMVDNVRTYSLEDAKVNDQKLRESMAENLWYFVSTTDVKQAVVTNAKLRNFSEKGFAIAHNFGGEMWYYDD